MKKTPFLLLLPGVTPGRYSLCSSLIEGRLDEPAQQFRIRQQAGAVPVRCEPVDIVAGGEQSIVAILPSAGGAPGG